MGRDDKRDRSPGAAPSGPDAERASRPAGSLEASAHRDGEPAERAAPEPRTSRAPAGAEPRRFDLRRPAAAPPATPAPARARSPRAAVALAAAALIFVALGRGVVLRTALPLALALAALGVLVRDRRRPAPPAPAPSDAPPPPRRDLSVAPTGIAFHGEADAPLFAASPPFGVTLVTSRARDRLVAAITSSQGAFYVGTSLPRAVRDASAALVARASIVGDEEVGLEAIGPDGEPVELDAEDLLALVRDLVRADPTCLDRCLLSDARGGPVVLDGATLRARGLTFDLAAPLTWRSLVFQEPFGQAVAVYQGTWLRQGTAELVLVSLLPSIEASVRHADGATGVPELDRAALRDLRLGRASPEAPPPAELRVAIDRLFMMPLRAALDRAPVAPPPPPGGPG